MAKSLWFNELPENGKKKLRRKLNSNFREAWNVDETEISMTSRMINYIVRKSWPRVEIANRSGVIKNIVLVKFHFFAIDIVNNAENVKLLAPPTNYVDVSRGVSRLRCLKKKSSAVQSSRHFTPYFLRDCVVRAVKRPLPEAQIRIPWNSQKSQSSWQPVRLWT